MFQLTKGPESTVLSERQHVNCFSRVRRSCRWSSDANECLAGLRPLSERPFLQVGALQEAAGHHQGSVSQCQRSRTQRGAATRGDAVQTKCKETDTTSETSRKTYIHILGGFLHRFGSTVTHICPSTKLPVFIIYDSFRRHDNANECQLWFVFITVINLLICHVGVSCVLTEVLS